MSVLHKVKCLHCQKMSSFKSGIWYFCDRCGAANTTWYLAEQGYLTQITAAADRARTLTGCIAETVMGNRCKRRCVMIAGKRRKWCRLHWEQLHHGRRRETELDAQALGTPPDTEEEA